MSTKVVITTLPVDPFVLRLMERQSSEVEDDGGTGWREPDCYTRREKSIKLYLQTKKGSDRWELAFAVG